ncbi:unnamed protein product [Acanthoscelides obtectus]|uniref:Uncharacterized protein n=1 Tax=Acanthoscelides obtectus TaxID=200917 RepID=A0A9P0K194_ACAOB|nr:unnamed protein product [Acanthoscelides obtectus]CAK1639468.1 hypothetical protein AOBTE_LOCUS11194 [Acanthoscelides obtectus]
MLLTTILTGHYAALNLKERLSRSDCPSTRYENTKAFIVGNRCGPLRYYKGEHPAAMQHGGQLRHEYPLTAVLLSILIHHITSDVESTSDNVVLDV